MSISKFEQFKKNKYEEEQIEFMKNNLNKVLYNNIDLCKKR